MNRRLINRPNKGRNKMSAVVKPIRQTAIGFSNSIEAQKFMNYATSNSKTKSDELEWVREKMKNHRPIQQKR